LSRKPIIHPSAVIEGKVNLEPGCVIEPFVFCRGDIRAGKGCYFSMGANIQGMLDIGSHVFLGERVTIGFPSQPQILQFQGEKNEAPWQTSKRTKIGDHCIIRSGSIIYASSQLGNNVHLGHNVLVREEVKIGHDTLVGTGVVIDGNSSVGKGVSIQTNVYIPWNTQIEDQVFLGPNCILTNDKYVMRTKYELKGPIIRKGVSVGAGAIILPSIEIGAEAVIGAGAVVTKNVPPKAIAYGVPARVHATIPANWKMPMK
jgi:acetyltransferase-like isoleucine patch superfamily enzyme